MPLDESPPVDKDGFLVLHSESARDYRPERCPQPVAALAGDPASLVLLGPAGSGKSTVLEALRSAEPEAVDVDLRASQVEHIEEALDAAIETGGPVYLDALDTAVGDPQLLRALERWLTSHRARQVVWRLACRPAAWHACFARSLADALGGLRQLRLLPAVDRWRAQRLPDDSLEAMRLKFDQWLPGQGEGRGWPAMSAERQPRIACRLGAIAVFSHARGFTLDDRGADAAVSVAELPSAPEPDEPNAPVTFAEYQSVLDSALFDPAAQATMAFRDRGDANFLAAVYLVERGVDRDRLHQLLGVQPDGLVPPTTIGVAAWVTALAPQLAADLVAANAVALARVGLAFPGDHVKATIVDHLLTGASRDTVSAGQDVDLARLAHPGLAEQLEHTMDAGLGQPERLWWLGRLAAAGRCHRLVEPLVAHALDPAWPSWARGAAVDVVIQLGEPAHRQRLADLLDLGEANDPDDELLGRALTALYPHQLSTAGMLAALRPSRNKDVLGAYYDFLHDVAGLIPDDDLPMVLAWLADHLEGNLDEFASVAKETIERAWAVWTQSGSEPLLLALAALLCRIDNTVGLSTIFWGPEPWFEAAQAPRLRLAIAVAEQLGATGEWRELYRTFLVEPADADALLETLPGLSPPAQLPLVSCVAEIASWEPTRESADRILTLPADHPAYEATAELREPCPLDPTTGRHSRCLRRRPAGRRSRAVHRPARAEAGCGPGLRKTQALRVLARVGEWAPTATAAACRRLQGQGGELSTYASQLRCRLDPSSVVREWLTTDPCAQELLELVPFLDDTRLDLREVGQLSELLLDRFPIAETRRLCHVHDRGMPFETCWRRDVIRKRLAEYGAVDQLEQLIADRPEPDLDELRREVRLARANAADQALAPLDPAQLLGQL